METKSLAPLLAAGQCVVSRTTKNGAHAQLFCKILSEQSWKDQTQKFWASVDAGCAHMESFDRKWSASMSYAHVTTLSSAAGHPDKLVELVGDVDADHSAILYDHEEIMKTHAENVQQAWNTLARAIVIHATGARFATGLKQVLPSGRYQWVTRWTPAHFKNPHVVIHTEDAQHCGM